MRPAQRPAILVAMGTEASHPARTAGRESDAAPGTPAATRLQAAWLLSALIVALMAAASVGGLWIGGLYQDPAAVSARFRASDLVTLAVAAPVLAVSLLASRDGSPRAQLVWVAMLAYAVYSYAFYVFGTAFNDFFLLHVALFSASLFALVFALAGIDAAGIGAHFRARTPVRGVSVFLALLALSLGGIWSYNSLRFAVTGQPPEEAGLVGPIAGVHLAYVLDLSLLVPGYALAAVLLWRRIGWGFVLATVLLASGVVLQLSYVAARAFQADAQVAGATAFDPVEPLFVVGYVAATAVMLANLTGAPTSRLTRLVRWPAGRR